MSNLKSIEKLKIEKLFNMEGGYVLDFSNRSFQEFILDGTGLDIYDSKYDYASGSKANRLREFWRKESNYVAGQLLSNLLEYWRTKKLTTYTEISQGEQTLYDECQKIAERLKQDTSVEHIDVIRADSSDKDFSLLAKSIRENIKNNEPEAALDRLHTFVVKYIRQLCEKHEIEYGRNRPLHSLFGGYVKCLKQKDIIDSLITERILKSSISILEAFNDVRNNQSFAHDNPILNYNESILIFNNVSSTIKFIESIEQRIPEEEKSDVETAWDDIPF